MAGAFEAGLLTTWRAKAVGGAGCPLPAASAQGALTARALVQTYLDRIEAYDRNGPCLNSIISINPQALAEADRPFSLDQGACVTCYQFGAICTSGCQHA